MPPAVYMRFIWFQLFTLVGIIILLKILRFEFKFMRRTLDLITGIYTFVCRKIYRRNFYYKNLLYRIVNTHDAPTINNGV